MADVRPKSRLSWLPPAEPADAGYDRDFCSWSLEQARLVREGRWDAIDRANVAEEIGSFGREQFTKLESAQSVLMLHMLKWDHQPGLRSRSWARQSKRNASSSTI